MARNETLERWQGTSWEEKARENPLYAVMTTDDFEAAGPSPTDDELLAKFFAKGVALWEKHVKPLTRPGDYVMEYGCGAGRILRAIHDAGHRCGGIDISPTMIEHAKRLTPSLIDLYVLDAEGRSEAPGARADVVFSYAVVQHIASLKAYTAAIDEMCRVLKPGGRLAIQVNCMDYAGADLANPGRTENFEDHSLHWPPGAEQPFRHNNNNWSGVHIGNAQLCQILGRNGVEVHERYFHNPKKPKAVWFVGRKDG